MPDRTKVVEIELSQPIEAITNLAGCQIVTGLLRWDGIPIDWVQIPVTGDRCAVSQIVQAVTAQHKAAIAYPLVLNRLNQPDLESWQPSDLLRLTPVHAAAPMVSVALCLAQGDRDITACLEALQRSTYPHLEILVVEQATTETTVKNQVERYGKRFRYLATAVTGLNAARNLAIQTAQGEIIAYLDPALVPLPGWVEALATTFTENPAVMAITGLAIPNGSETNAQYWFEQRYSLGRGLKQQWYQLDQSKSLPWSAIATMAMGTGTNVAFRRHVFEKIGGFDPALDLPGMTEGGGDLEMFCRVLLSGLPLLYQPRAIAQYTIPKSEAAVRAHIQQHYTGIYAYIAAGLQRYPQLRNQFLTLAVGKIARTLLLLPNPGLFPRRLLVVELLTMLTSLGKYQTAQKSLNSTDLPTAIQNCAQSLPTRLVAVRTVEINQPLPELTDVAEYRQVRVFVTAAGRPIGFVDIEHYGCSISAARLRQAITQKLALELLAIPHQQNTDAALASLQLALADYLRPTLAQSNAMPTGKLPSQIPVSIVITTCDRPADLEACLQQLLAQQTERPVEIVVADNRPASGLTPPVVAKFPGIKLVQESRPGGSYGRNAAIAVTTGEIIVSVDDDVTVPTDWLEHLIAPMARPEVMMVTGNVLPKELETAAQFLFENLKGGLSSGFQPREVDGNWLASFERRMAPIWELGVSANAAYRASIFCHPQIGLMDEALGPGTPTTGGEENHLMYKVLKAGYTLVYEPKAYVWHRHRREIKAFYRQVYGHMQGGTACFLTLWLKENDLRACWHLFSELPRYYTRRIYGRLRGWHDTPWRFLGSEIAGYLTGFWGYWQSCQRVKQLGRSAPYIPLEQRRSHSTTAEAFVTAVKVPVSDLQAVKPTS